MESTYYDERVITYFKIIFVFLVFTELFKTNWIYIFNALNALVLALVD